MSDNQLNITVNHEGRKTIVSAVLRNGLVKRIVFSGASPQLIDYAKETLVSKDKELQE